jgi:large subunit ribosomal protein L25
MAETKSLAASVRSGVGKGAARSVRREGRIPAVVYGGGEPPTPIALSWHEVNKLIYAGHFMTTTFELDIEGAKERVIPRDYQLDRVRDRPLHVDFLRLKKGQRIDVEIPVHLVGQDRAPGLKRGGVLNIVLHVLELNVVADAIPENVEIDISKLEIGDSVHISDLKLPGGARLSTSSEAEETVLTLAPPLVEQEEEPAAAADAPAAADAGKAEKAE